METGAEIDPVGPFPTMPAGAVASDEYMVAKRWDVQGEDFGE